jgi:hypothetical protein
MSVSLLALLLLPPAFTAASPPSPRLACYRYDSDSAALSGHVVRRVYAGRPNYQSVQAGDQADTVFVLQLEKPLCTVATSDFPARAAVREVQVYFSGDL